MGGGPESRCVGREFGADGAVHHPHRCSCSICGRFCRDLFPALFGIAKLDIF